MLEEYLLQLLSYKTSRLKLQVLHFSMNHHINITTVTACHKQVYFKMPLATLVLCLTALQPVLPRLHWVHLTLEGERGCLGLSLPPWRHSLFNSPMERGEGPLIQPFHGTNKCGDFTRWDFSQHNHIPIASYFLHGQCVMCPGGHHTLKKARGTKCTAAWAAASALGCGPAAAETQSAACLSPSPLPLCSSMEGTAAQALKQKGPISHHCPFAILCLQVICQPE